MSYTPTTWVNGDTITAAKLNKMEQGIADGGGGGAALIITDTSGTLDKTFAEIYNALLAGTPCYIHYTGNCAGGDLDDTYTYFLNVATIVKVFKYDDMYRVYAATNSNYSSGSYDHMGIPGIWTYSAADSSSYPTYYRLNYVGAAYVADDGNR